jgi:tetratricopeptide (TPR) repeat protein
MRCYQCGQLLTLVGNFAICPEHGAHLVDINRTGLVRADEEPPHLIALSRDLPFPLALVISEYIPESNPFVKLHRLTDAAELITRFATIILLSDILRQRGGFPEALRLTLCEKIERPTFGAWKDLLALACDNLPKRKGQAECFVVGLPDYIRKRLLPILGDGDADAFRQIIALRNLLAHQGRLHTDQAQELLSSHHESFETLLSELDFLTRYNLIAHDTNGRWISLRGFPQIDGSFNTYDRPNSSETLQPQSVALVHETELLDMFPLHVFGDAFQWRDEDMERLANDVPQLYFRLSGKGYMEFTPFSNRISFSQQRGLILARFKEVFQLEEWRSLIRAGRQHKDLMFSDTVNELIEVFVGREDHVRQVKDSLKRCDHGMLWLSGKPGVGKSALMARLIQDYQHSPQHYLVIPYFFRIGQSGNSTDHFVRASLVHLQVELGRSLSLGTNPEVRRLQMVEALREVSERTGKKILFLIDGLDEIYQLEPSFMLLLFAARAPRVVWLCAGRSEVPELEASLQDSGAQWIFADGLPPLRGQAIRAMLTEHLERLKYQLFMRDHEKDGKWSNLFVEAMVRKSEGLPLYVQMALEDLREGKLRTVDEEKLPQGLQAYFEQVLERLRVSDVGAILTPIFCLLAWAKEPVTEKALKVLLTTHDLSQDRDWDWLFQKAIDQGHLMLQRRVNMSGECGWTIYHESFRQHVLTTGAVKVYRRQCQKRWLEVCGQWQSLSEGSLERYALRHYAKHLYEAERYEDLYSLAENESFLREQVLSLDEEPHAPLDTIQSALKAALAEDNAAMMAKLSLAHARRVRTITQESPLDALRRLGSLKRAWELADFYDIERCVLWYLLLAWELKEDGKTEDAQRTLARLLKKDPPRLSMSGREAAINMLVCVFEISGDIFTDLHEHLLDGFGLTSLFKKLAIRYRPALALELVQRFEDENKRASGLEGIASAQVKTGDFEAAIETAKYSSKESTLSWTLNKIAVEQAKTNKVATAIATVRSINHPNAQSNAFTKIVEILANTSEQPNKRESFNAVIRVAPQFLEAGVWERDEIAKALNDLLLTLTLAGELNVAQLEALIAQGASWIDDKSLRSIAKALARGGNFTAAIATAQLIGESSLFTGEIYVRDQALKAIAEFQMETDDCNAALATAQLIGGRRPNPWGLSVIAGLQAKAGDSTKASQNFAAAIEMATKSHDIVSLSLITLAQSKATNQNEARGAIAAAAEIAKATNNDSRIGDISVALAEVGELDAALDIAQLLNSPGMITLTLQRVAVAQAEAGDGDKIWKTLSGAIVASKHQSDHKELVRDLCKIETTLSDQAKKEVKAGKFDVVIETTKQMDECVRGNVLGAIVDALLDMGNFPAAISTAKLINTEWQHTWSFNKIAAAQTEIGDYLRARETFAIAIQGVTEERIGAWCDMALKDLTIAKIEKSEFSAASKIALSITNITERTECLRTIATAQVKAGDVAQAQVTLAIAFDIAHRLTDIETQLRELSYVVAALVEIGESGEAQRKLTVIADAVHQFNKPRLWISEWGRDQIARNLCYVAWEQVRTNDCLTAIETVRLVADIGRGDHVLYELVEALCEFATVRADAGELIESRTILRAAIEMTQLISEEWQQITLFTRLAEIQAKAGGINEALDTSRLITDEKKHTHTLVSIALVQAAHGETGDMRKTFTTALHAAHQMKDIRARTECLTLIASAQAKAGEEAWAVKTFAAAIDTARIINQARRRFRRRGDFEDTQQALCTITRRQTQAGEFSAAVETSDLIDDLTERISLLCSVAVAQAQVGQNISARELIARALDNAQAVRDTEEQDRALKDISHAQTQIGELVDAIDTAHLINGRESQDVILKTILEVQTNKGEFTTALEIAEQIDDAKRRAECLIAIASAQAEAGEMASSQETFAAAIDAAWQLNKSTKKARKRGNCCGEPAETLLAIAVSQSEAGAVGAAHETLNTVIELAQHVSDETGQGKCLSAIVEAKANSGDLIAAIEIASLIREPERRTGILTYIAMTRLRFDNMFGVPEALNAAVESAKQIKDAEKRTQELKEIAVRQAEAKIGEQAVQTAEAMTNQRNRHLPEIAGALTKISDLRNFKRLLIPCAYYLDAAYTMCGLLGRMYPESADRIAKDALVPLV